MKKFLPVLLALILLLTMPVFAADGKLSATAKTSGSEVTITLHLDNPGIIATRIIVRYDSAVLQLTDAQNGTVFPKGNAVFGKDVTDNPYAMLWDESLRRDNNTNSGTLATLTFSVKGGTDSGKTSVRFAVDDPSTFDVDLNSVEIADCSCSVSVPVVTTKDAGTTAAASTKSTMPATTVKQPVGTAGTTTTTKAASTTASATKQIGTTAKITAASGQKTTYKLPEKLSSAVSAAASSAAAAAKESKTTAAGSKVPATVEQGTTAAQREETKLPTGLFDAEEIELPDVSVSDGALTDGTLSTAAETQTEPLIDPEPPTNHRGLLWLLLLIPAAAAVVILIAYRKKH